MITSHRSKQPCLIFFEKVKSKNKKYKMMPSSRTCDAHARNTASNNSSLSSIGSDIDADWKVIQQELRKGGHWSTMSARVAIAKSSKIKEDTVDEKEIQKNEKQKIVKGNEETSSAAEKVQPGLNRRLSTGSLTDLLNISSHVKNRRGSSNTSYSLDDARKTEDGLGSRLWKNSKSPVPSDPSTRNIYEQIQGQTSVANRTKIDSNTPETSEPLKGGLSSLGALRAQLVKSSSLRNDLQEGSHRPQLGAQPAMSKSLRSVLRMELASVKPSTFGANGTSTPQSSTEIRKLISSVKPSPSGVNFDVGEASCFENDPFDDPPPHYKGGIVLETWGDR